MAAAAQTSRAKILHVFARKVARDLGIRATTTSPTRETIASEKTMENGGGTPSVSAQLTTAIVSEVKAPTVK
jgi:hypothetical protein